jgi:aspartate/methionine/tyrosine aminotransferase
MRFSSRLPPDLRPNGLARGLAGRRSADLELLDLTQSNPTRCGFDYPAEAIRAALAGPGALGYDPDPRGAAAAREMIAESWGHGLAGRDLLLTTSTSEAYAWLFKLVGDPGDDILVQSPGYPLFEWLARMEGLEARPLASFGFEGWRLDTGTLEAACGPRTRAVVVVNPNNPTGHYLSRNDWSRLSAICADRDLLLIVDEVFSAYPLEPAGDAIPSVLEDPAPACLTAVLSGLSKGALLPQLKLAWTAIRGPGASACLEGLEFVADQYLPVSAAVQAAVPGLLKLAPDLQAQAAARLRLNLAELDLQLAEAPAWSRPRIGGGWSTVLRRPAIGSDGDFVVELLHAQGVLIHPSDFFGFGSAGHLVASLLTDPGIFRAGIRRMLDSGPPV